jgi:putative sterol carrier protein
MRSRCRRVLLWAIFRTIRQRAQPETRVNAVVEFRIAGRRDGGVDRYQLAFTSGRCMTSRHNRRRPALTLTVEPVAFLHLVGGTASPQRLFIAGRLKLRGDLILALALPATLGIPGRRPRAPARKR